jgi:hypothetical protein
MIVLQGIDQTVAEKGRGTSPSNLHQLILTTRNPEGEILCTSSLLHHIVKKTRLQIFLERMVESVMQHQLELMDVTFCVVEGDMYQKCTLFVNAVVVYFNGVALSSVKFALE